MNIGVLTTSWPHDRDPIAGSFVRALTAAIVARGHRCTVVFAAMNAPAQPLAIDGPCALVPVRCAPGDRSLFYQGGAAHHARSAPIESALLAASFTTMFTARAASALRACDALVSHWAVPSSLVASAIARGRPHHAIVHGTDALLLARLPAALHRAIARGCTSLQFAHPALRDALDPSLSRHARAMDLPMAAHEPDPQALRDREATRAALSIPAHATLVASVSRLAHEKGLDALSIAARSLSPDARVVIAGDGPERARLEALARGRVTFLGALDARARDRLLAAADVFALPSLRDGAPTALVEALRYQRPVVATRVGGIPWLARDAALYVEPGAPDELAHTINSLVNSQLLRDTLRARAAERSRALPTWNSAADHILRSVGATQ